MSDTPYIDILATDHQITWLRATVARSVLSWLHRPRSELEQDVNAATASSRLARLPKCCIMVYPCVDLV